MTKITYAENYIANALAYRLSREQRMINQMDDYFWKCFDYLRDSGLHGDYLEFGCGCCVRSFRFAAKYKTVEYNIPKLFAFDSFAGLPERTGIDVYPTHPKWVKGAMAVSLEEFHKTMKDHGYPQTGYTVVPGFYEDTLRGKSPQNYGVEKVAFAFIDCDLYASAALALEFVADALESGAILAFDDWHCFGSNPERGEQKAFSELMAARPEFIFSEFLSFGWHGKSFIVNRR